MSTEEHDAFGRKFTYLTFYLCGGSNVLGWSSFILCIDFFIQTYPHGIVPFIFPIINMSILFLVTAFVLFAGRILPIDGRIYFGYFLQIASLISAPMIQILDLPVHLSYYLTLLSLLGCSLSGAVVQSSLYGMASVFGSTFLQAMEGGKGAVGVLLVLIRIATKYSFGDENQLYSLFYFFGFSTIFSISALMCYCILHRIEYAAPMLREYKYVQVHTPINSTVDDEASHLLTLAPKEHMVTAAMAGRRVWKPMVVLFMTYTICLSCFPGLSTSVHSVTFHLKDWLAVILISSYNLGDLIGKSLPGYYRLLTIDTLHYPMVLELLFIPLFLTDVLHPIGDVFTILLVFTLGIFTGYTGTSSLMIAPTLCEEREKEMAGIICSLSLIIGLFVGSYVGLGLEYIVKS